MSDDLDLNALREIASAATDGPWEMTGVLHPVAENVGLPFVQSKTGWPAQCQRSQDARHIAAFDPPTPLALIERAEAAEKDRDNVRDYIARTVNRAEAAEATVARVEALAQEFHGRLPDGTGNGRPYNSHEVARRIRAALEGPDHV